MDKRSQDAEFRFRNGPAQLDCVLPQSNARYQKSPSVHTAPSLAGGTGPNPADGKQGHINHCGTVAHAKKTQLPALPSLPTPCPTCACSCPELPLRCPFPAHGLRHPVHTRPLPLPTCRRPRRVMQDSLWESSYGVTYGRSNPLDYARARRGVG